MFLMSNFAGFVLEQQLLGFVGQKLHKFKIRESASVSATPAKGGRGKKGGVSAAARGAGIPRSTAQRRQKPAHNTQSGQVSSTPGEVRSRHRGGDRGGQEHRRTCPEENNWSTWAS
jgi:hypothetical protein